MLSRRSPAKIDASRGLAAAVFVFAAGLVIGFWPRRGIAIPWKTAMAALARQDRYELHANLYATRYELQAARDGARIAMDEFFGNRLLSHYRSDGLAYVRQSGRDETAWRFPGTLPSVNPLAQASNGIPTRTAFGYLLMPDSWRDDEPIFEEAEPARTKDGVIHAVLRYRRIDAEVPQAPDRLYVRLEPETFRMLGVEHRIGEKTLATYEFSYPDLFPKDRFSPVSTRGVPLKEGRDLLKEVVRFLWAGRRPIPIAGRQVTVSRVLFAGGYSRFVFVKVEGPPLETPPQIRDEKRRQPTAAPITRKMYGGGTGPRVSGTTYYAFDLAVFGRKAPSRIRITLEGRIFEASDLNSMSINDFGAIAKGLDFDF